MLEWKKSRSGHSIPVVDGYALCSTIDPIKEAQQWVGNYSEAIIKCQTVFVLGLAGGYHVVCLRERYVDKKIIVIDNSAEIVNYFFEKQPVLQKDIYVYPVQNVSELKVFLPIRQALKSFYFISIHAPSYQRFPFFYSCVQEFLIGRSMNGLKEYLQFRPEMAGLFKTLAFDQSEYCHIKLIEGALKKRGSPLEWEGMIWMALRELVQ